MTADVPFSAMLTPPIAPSWPTPTVAAAGALITGLMILFTAKM
jgi:hypothetical protein